ncbi:MAG TPA: NUDIX hydrolase [Chloroflexota bacterium]|nr:NUDIX hydrolase [Chloroflexota bacterium]
MPTLPESAQTGQGYCLVCGTPLEARRHEDRDRPTCPACGYIHYLDPKIAVAVILGNDHGVLLGRRRVDPSSGLWSFPAGYVNRGEVLEEAAVREVSEEFGVAVRLTGLVGVYSERDAPVVLVVYAGEVRHGELRPDGHEVSEIRRFGLEALPAELAFPHDRQVLADWKRALQTGRLIGAYDSKI